MAEYESTSTSGAVTSVFSTKSPSDGATSYEVHWSAYTSEAECAAGETVIVVAKDTGVAPVIKATIPEIHYLGYAGTPTITASVVGNDVVLEANGIVLKDISWTMRIE